LRTNSTIDRLGIKGAGHIEDLHGLALGVPAGWVKKFPVATTIFP